MAATRTWDGGGSTNNWSDCVNWSLDTCPGTADVATFDATSSKNATIDASFTTGVTTFNMNAGYAGVITQARSFAVSGNTTIAAGTFNGDTSNLTFTGTFAISAGAFTGGNQTVQHTGAFTISGGTYTASSGTTTYNAAYTHTAGGTFAHNNGTTVFTGGTTTTNVITTETFYNLTINKNNGILMTVSTGDTLAVTNALTLTNGGFTTGTVNVTGTLSVGAGWDGGGGTLTIGGTTLQTVSLTGGSPALASTVTLNNANFTFNGTGAGTLNFAAFNLQAGTLEATGYSATFSGAYVQSGASTTFTGGSGTVTHTGAFTLSDGTYTATSGTTAFAAGFTHTAATGSFVEGSGLVKFTGSAATVNVNVTEAFNSLEIAKNTGVALTITSGDTLTVNGTTTLTDGQFITGTLNVKGTLAYASTWDGPGASGTLLIDGSNTQNLALTGAQSALAFTVTLNNVNFTFSGTGAGTLNFAAVNLQAGTIDATGYSMTFSGAYVQSGASTTFTGGSGTVTHTGAFTLSDGTYTATSGTTVFVSNFTHTAATGSFVEGSGLVKFTGVGTTFDVNSTEAFNNLEIAKSNAILTIATGDTLVVNGTTTLTDGAIGTGTLNTKGGITNTATWDGYLTSTSGTILADGSAVASLSVIGGGPSVVTTLTVNNANFTVNGTGAGTLSFRTVNLQSGTIDLTGYAGIFYSGITQSGGTLTSGNGTVTYQSAVAVSGGTMNLNGSTTTFSSTFALSGTGTLNGGSATVTHTGTLTITGGTYNASSGTTSVAAAYTHTAGGTFSAPAGTFVASSAVATWDVASSETFFNLQINTAAANTITVASGDKLVVNGTLSLTNGELSTGTISAMGDVNVASTWDGGTANSVLSLDGTGVTTTTLTNGGNNTEPANILIVNNANATVNAPSSGVSYLFELRVQAGTFNAAGSALTIGSNYQQSGGIFNGSTNTIVHTGTFTLSGGTYNASSGTTNIASTFTHTAGGTFSAPSGTIAANGGAATWDVATTETVNNLEMNTTGTSTLAFGVGDTFVVNGNLTLTNGQFGPGAMSVLGNMTQQSTWDGGANATANSITMSGTAVATVTLPNGAIEPADSLILNNPNVTASAPATGAAYLWGMTLNDGTFDAQGATLTVGSSFVQAGGHFVGSSAAVTHTGAFTLSGGTYDATTATTTFSNTFTHTAGGTFAHNNGTVTYNGSASISWDIAGTETFNNFTFAGGGLTTDLTLLTGDTYVVNGTFTLSGATNAIQLLGPGTVDAKGNVVIAMCAAHTASLLFSGTADQSINATGGADCYDGNITVSKASGTVTVLSALTVDAAGQTVSVTSGTLDLNGQTVATAALVVDGGTLNVGNGSLSTGAMTVSSGTFNGNGATVTHSGAFTLSGGTYNATTGNTNFKGAFTHTVGGTFAHNNGTVVSAFTANGATWDVAGSEEFYHFRFLNTSGFDTTLSAGDRFVVNGTLSIDALNTTSVMLGTGTLVAKGNVAITVCGSHSVPISFEGTADQTVTNSGTGTCYAGTITVNKPSGTVTFLSPFVTSSGLVATSGTLDLNGQTISVSSLTVNGGTLQTGAGAFTVTGTTTMSSGTFSGNSATVTHTGAFTLSGGTYTASSGTTSFGTTLAHTAGGTFAHSNGLVVAALTSHSAWDVATSETFYDFTLNANSGWNLTVSSGDTLVVERTLTLTRGGLVTGTVEPHGDVSVASTFSGGSGGASLKFQNTTVDQSFDLTTFAAWNLPITINKASGTVTLASDLTTTGSSTTFTLQSGTFAQGTHSVLLQGAYSQSGGTYAAASGTFNLNASFALSGGTYNATTGTMSVSDTWTHTAGGTFNHNGGTVLADIGAHLTWDFAGTETFNNFTLNGSANWVLTVAAGDTILALGAMTLTNGAVNTGTLEARGNVLLESGFDSGTGSLVFSGTAPTQTLTVGAGASDLFNGDVTVNKASGSVELSTSALTLNASNQDLTIQSGTFSLNGLALTVNGTSGTMVVQNGGTFQLQGGEAVTLNASNPTLQAGSTVRYVGTSGPYILKNYAYKSVAIDGGVASVFALPATLSLGENLTVSSGILSLSGNGLTVTGAVSNLGTIRLQGGESVTLTNDSDSGTVEYVGDADAAADAYTLKNWPYYHLLINFADAGDSVTAASSPLTVAGTYTLAEGTFTAPTTMNVAGNFAHTGGTFAHNGGTVVLNGTNQTVSGTTTFNNLTKNVTTAATLTLPASVAQTVLGMLTLNGAAGQLLSLRSSTPGVQAIIDPQGGRSLSYLDVEDNDNANVTAVQCTVGCVEGTNVTDWSFSSSGITVGAISGNTTEAGGTATFTVVLTGAPSSDVTVPVSTSDATEGTVSPASLTFTSLDWNVPQTVTVTGADDFLDDGDVAYTVVVGSVSSADLTYDGIDPSDVPVTNSDNDASGFAVGAISGNTNEAGGTATFTLVLTAQPAADVSVGLSSSDATEGTVSPASLTFTALDWDTPQTVTVTGADDFLDDGDVVYTVVTGAAVSADGNYNAVNPGDVSVTNEDDDVTGVSNSSVSGHTSEAEDAATFTVVLTVQPTADVTIPVSTSDATEGTVSPASLTFTALNWNVPQTVTATGVNDYVDDGDVAYTVVLGAITSVDPSYSGIDPSDVSVTNDDDDVTGVSVSGISGNTTEAGGTATFTVVLNSQPTASVTIGLSTSDATEGTVSPASVTFTTGNWNTPRTVTVTGVDDLVDDGTVAYTIVTAAATTTDLTYGGLNAGDVSVSTTDDDTAGITVGAISGNTTEAGGTATFTVVLNTSPVADVIIDLLSSDTTEGTVIPQLTFTSDNWSTPQTVTVTGVDDLVDDGDVGFFVATAAATSADAPYNGLNAADVSVTNEDDDAAGITVGAVSGNTTEAGGTATFTVVLTGAPSADVVVPISSSDTTEGTVSPASLTFTALNWDTPQTVTVTGVDDVVIDGNVAHSIVTGAAESADLAYHGVNPADVSVTNSDNDTAGFTVGAVSGDTTEAGGTATFTVVLNVQPDADVSVGLSSSDTTEGTVSPASLTFTALNWDTPQTVTAAGVDDGSVDGNVAYSIVTGAAVSADLNYDGLNPNDVSVTNQNDDAVGVSLGAVSGNTTEAGGTATFTVALTSEPTADVTIGITSSDTTEGTVSPSSLTFTSGNWNVPQTVTATGADDSADDGNVSYSLALGAAVSADGSYDGLDPSDVSLANQDNDTAGFALVESSDDTTVTEGGSTDAYTVVLTSQPMANVTVYFIGDGDVSTSAAQVVFTSDNWNVPQAAVVSAVDDSSVEGTEVHSILHVVSSADAQYGVLTLDGVPVSVLDNDTAGQDSGGGGGGGGGGGAVVTGPTINISNPVVGRTYAPGSLRVSWSWTGSIPAVNVYLSWDNGETWALQRYFVTNTGSTTVTLDRESASARVRVEGTDFISSILNEYSGTFSVSLDAEAAVNGLEEPLTEQQILAQQDAAAAVAARVATLPASFPLHGLVKLPNDNDPETQYDTTVYYVGADGYRHAFPNTHVFGSWFCDGIEAVSTLSAELSANVKVVTPEEMAAVPLGPNVTYRPGYKMVKFITDPRVYVVDADGSLRWVISEGDAQTIYGTEWNTQIYDISDVFYRNYRFGTVLTDLSWNPETVRASVRYPSDVMDIPGYLTELSAETDYCPAN